MTDSAGPGDQVGDDLVYREILTAIVKRFVRLVGAPAALGVARKIDHLTVDDDGNVRTLDPSDPSATLGELIDQYRAVFGGVAVTMSQLATQAADDSLLQEIGLLPGVRPPIMRILLVDDHVLFREGLVRLIDPQPDMKVAGQAGTVKEAVAMSRDQRPDLVLMDISLPDGTGQEATRAILADRPETRVVFLTVHDDDDELFAAIRAGAVGYLLKNVRAAELVDRLRAVARGEAGITPAIARRILSEFSHTPEAHRAPPPETIELTARELEIVRELARGASNREIARKLVISENTVKNHVRNVLSKLQLHSRRDVADYARDHGLTAPPSDASA